MLLAKAQLVVKLIQIHDNRYGRENGGVFCWIRVRATRNLKLEPELTYDHSREKFLRG
jgi:hypothetical protein